MRDSILYTRVISILILLTTIFVMVQALVCPNTVSTPSEGETLFEEFPECDTNEPLAWMCHQSYPEGFDDMIHEVAREYHMNPRTLALTALRESGCNPRARGGSGEIGLMQINPKVWRTHLSEKGLTDLWDPMTNLRAGAYILTKMRNRSRTYREAIRRYNGAGPKARRYASEQTQLYRNLFQEALWI